MFSVRLNTSTSTASTTPCQRWLREVIRTCPEPRGMKSLMSSGSSALSKTSSQRGVRLAAPQRVEHRAARVLDAGRGG